MTIPICEFYAVRNCDGEWLVSVAGYHGVEWDSAIELAKVYPHAAHARAMQTRVARIDSNAGAEVVRLVVTRCEVLDPVGRGTKRAAVLDERDETEDLRVAKRRLQDAEASLQREQKRIEDLKRQVGGR